LAELHRLPRSGRAHRALADAETAAHLLLREQQDLAPLLTAAWRERPVSHALLRAVQGAPRHQLTRCLARWCACPDAPEP
jgi:DNA polymerase-3 subunit epsilon